MSMHLLQHQTEGIQWIQREGRGLLGDEPGLGKTRIAIESAPPGRVAVVAPAMVITGGTWKDELAKWADDPTRFTVLPYSGLNVRKKTKRGGYAPTEELVPAAQGRFSALIVDECHYTKNRGTLWTSSVEDIARRSDQVLEMTGTPIPNWAHEMYTVLRVLHPQEAKRGGRFGSYWRWVGDWFEVGASYFNPEARVIGGLKACTPGCKRRPPTDPCQHYHEFMSENFGGKFLRRLRDDCLDLPPVTESIVETPMEAKQRKLYRELKADYSATVNDREVLAWSEGAKNVLLDKVATSPWLLDPQGPPAGGKFEQLRYDLQTRNRPTLVLAHYRDVVEACAGVAGSLGASAGYVHGGVTKKAAGDTIERFKAGKLDVLVGSLETVAEGLQLTVADMAIFVETSYKTYRNVQARQRVHRLGQTRPVTIREYVTPNSIDSRKRKLLAAKTEEQVRMMSAGDFKTLL